ncbi:hypothetical protein GCM10027565_48350 [Bordetella tumulicola]
MPRICLLDSIHGECANGIGKGQGLGSGWAHAEKARRLRPAEKRGQVRGFEKVMILAPEDNPS